jgi:hypothetical protein
VQRSAFPERYDERAAQASRLLRRHGGVGGERRGGNRGIRSARLSPALLTEAVLASVAQAQPRPQIPSMGLAPPEFSAQVRMPESFQAPPSSGGPAPRVPDVADVLGPALTGLGLPQAGGRGRRGGARRGGGSGRRSGRVRGELLELFHDPGVNVDEGQRTDPIGRHGKHVHVALSNARDMLMVGRLAQEMGLAVRENPRWDPVDPVHSPGSLHDQRFRRRPRLGKAIDVSGDPAAMRAFNRRVARMFGA